MATIANQKVYEGHPELGRSVDGDTWFTPRYILDSLGKFDLDPCASDLNPQWVCENYYTKADNGLLMPWNGRVFMNPPFSNTIPWIQKHAEHGKGISLVPATTESQIWRKLVWKRAAAIFLLHGRTRFCRPDGSTTTGRPLRSIALIAWSISDAQVLCRLPFAGVLLTSWQIYPLPLAAAV